MICFVDILFLAESNEDLDQLDMLSEQNKAVPRFSKGNNTPKLTESFNVNKRIQCRECEDFGHIQSECANILKKKLKVKTCSWSDDDLDGSQDESEKHVSDTAFIASFFLPHV